MANRFHESINEVPMPWENPFKTPTRTPRAASLISAPASMPSPSVNGSYAFGHDHDSKGPELKQRKFKSARQYGEYQKPWLEKSEPRKIWDKIFFFSFVFAGLGLGAFMCYDGWRGVPHNEYCLSFEDTFSNGIDPANWNREVQIGGFGAGSFDWSTTDDRNAFVDGEGLHIVPTFTTETTSISAEQILDGYTLNLTKSDKGDGSCTNTEKVPGGACSTKSNATSGAIINPVRSARLNTKGKHSILYGKVEVEAKLPEGDWIWPAIWMMPEDETYGKWPASGEIDIMESKGNNGDQYPGGRDEVSGTIHWGPVSVLDLFYKTTGKRVLRRTDFSKGYHVFGLEWTPDYIYTYVDTRLAQSVFIRFGHKQGNMWTRGNFANLFVNGSAMADPWSQTGRFNTPFDQPFYLILNVAIGSSSGYFPDGVGNKPWIDHSPTAMRDFWMSRNIWEPTWGKGNDRGLSVKSVKMFDLGSCHSKV